MADLELSDLAVFKAVVEAGGIIAAGARLHRVPSSVSARIRQLESSLGTALFRRERRRLRLSSSGERLLPYAERLLALAVEAQGAVGGAPPHGVLKLGSLESTAASRLPSALAEFHRAHPQIRVELTTGTNDVLTSAVIERRLHGAFVAEEPVHPALAADAVFTERLVIISTASHPPIRSPRDVAGDSLIAFPRGCAYRRALDRWLGRSARASRPVLELMSYHAIVACVASGAGIALLPESVLDTMKSRGIARHRLPAVHAIRKTFLISPLEDCPPVLSALRHELASRAHASQSA
jgi:DNA-binding transcriptional LysR family regulator